MKFIKKIKDFLIKKKVDFACIAANKATDVETLIEDAKTTKFTKKIPQKIAMFCSTMLVAMMPTVAFADSSGTDKLNSFIDFACDWLVKIGAVIMLVGGVMFALGWQREDAEGKSRGLQTAMAGGMVAAMGGAKNVFGL